MKKLLSKRGESLVETMAAMMVITLGMTMLAGAVVASANANKQAEDAVSFMSDKGEALSVLSGSHSVSVTSEGSEGDKEQEISVIVIQRGDDANAVYSYELKKTAD